MLHRCAALLALEFLQYTYITSVSFLKISTYIEEIDMFYKYTLNTCVACGWYKLKEQYEQILCGKNTYRGQRDKSVTAFSFHQSWEFIFLISAGVCIYVGMCSTGYF